MNSSIFATPPVATILHKRFYHPVFKSVGQSRCSPVTTPAASFSFPSPITTGTNPMLIDLTNLTVTDLRRLQTKVANRITERLPYEKVAKLKTGSLISIEQNQQVKAMRRGGAYGWDKWFDFQFIGPDADNPLKMLVYGPLEAGNTKARTVSIPISLLRSVRKKA